MTEFEKYATGHLGMSSLGLHDYKTKTRMDPRALTPHVIEERQMNIQAIDVFSRLMRDRLIFLGTPVDDYVANVIMAQLLFLENANPKKDVMIYINSPGGSVYAGLGIYDVMQYIKPDVGTVCTGMAASMGAVLLAAGENKKRSALPHSRVMIHQPMGGAQGQASDIQIVAEQILKTKKELYEILSTHTGQSFYKIEKDSDRDYWMSANEAQEYGLIDDLIEYDIKTPDKKK